MEKTAKEVYKYFKKKGWSDNAIFGMLGNMQAESLLKADIDEISGGGGYGLVQWTPKSVLVNWAKSKGYNHREIWTQCERIQFELENGLQFYATGTYPMNFKEFSKSTKSPTYLAMAFCYNYERPYNKNQPIRSTYAESWKKTLVGGNTTNVGSNANGDKIYYTVKSGDVVSLIAEKYKVSSKQIKDWNKLDSKYTIYPKQKLVVGVNSKTQTYTIKSGDTLSGISQKYGSTITQLKQWNKIVDANFIRVGQKIRVK